jgi:fatty-acid peroxygenase
LAYRTRLAGRRALVVGGEEGAHLLYDQDRVRRRGAIPAPTKRALFGKGAVHGLDGAEHAHRKAMFIGLLDSEAVGSITASAAQRWSDTLTRWRAGETFAIQPMAATVLGGAALQWAGIPSPVEQVAQRSRQLVEVVDGFGSFGPRFGRSLQARRRSQTWIQAALLQARRRPQTAPPVLATVATHRNLDGSLLDLDVAAVEVHNLLRPTVAVSWLICFSALALARDPSLRAAVATQDDTVLEAFAHEVRRLYPFVPVLAGIATRGFDWQGDSISAGDLIVLDIYGSHHDESAWPRPDQFDLQRFRGREPGPFELLAQGGGDARTGHRCPGERLTIELLKQAAFMIAQTSWSISTPQTLFLRRMPPDLSHLRWRREST